MIVLVWPRKSQVLQFFGLNIHILDSQHTMKLGTSTQSYFCFPYCISSESHKALQVFLIKSFSPVWHRQKKCYFENNSVQQQLGCSVFLFHIMYQIFSKTLITCMDSIYLTLYSFFIGLQDKASIFYWERFSYINMQSWGASILEQQTTLDRQNDR